MKNKILSKLIFFFATVISTVNNRTPSEMQLSSERTTEKLVELVRPHVFIYNSKSDKHRDAQRLQNVWESISLEMGVDGMDGKCRVTTQEWD